MKILKKRNMKTKIFKIIAIVLLLAGSFSFCTKNELDRQNGIVPSSIEQVVDIIELKYGEEKECILNGQILKFSITDVEDYRECCELIDIIDEKTYNKIRIHAFIRIEKVGKVNQFKISSRPCGSGYRFLNTEAEIQYIWDYLESMQSCPANQMDASYFSEIFSFMYGEGIWLKDTLFSIYLSSVYPSACDNIAIKKNTFKFIFIITKK